LPKLAPFDLKCVGLRRSPDPLIVRGNAPSALATLYFVSIFTSRFPFRAPPLRNSWIRHCVCVTKGNTEDGGAVCYLLSLLFTFSLMIAALSRLPLIS